MNKELIHMEIFDLKDTFNKKIDELDEQIKKLKNFNEEKSDEINQLNDKNHNITNIQKKTESELKIIIEKLRNIENELSQKILLWKKTKSIFLRIINDNKTLLDNNFPLKEYNDVNVVQSNAKENNIFAALENLIKEKLAKSRNSNSNFNYAANNNNNYYVIY
jgi:sugar-specific transcriptional regulator TrmB